MADKAEKKPDAAPAPAPEKKDGHEKAAAAAGGGMLAKTPVVLAVAMVLEALVLFAGFKFLGGSPKPAVAVELSPEKKGDGRDEPKGARPSDHSKLVELVVVDFKAPNTQNGRRYLYDVSICAVVRPEHEQKAKDAFKARENSIKDRVRTIIAQMDPEKLGGGSEPELNTLRRQIKVQLENIIGDDMIAEVLVPRCTPFRADF